VTSLFRLGADDLASVLLAGADGLAVTLLFSDVEGLAVDPADLVATPLFSEVDCLAETLLSEFAGLSAALLLVCETLLPGVAALSEAFLVVAGVEVLALLLLDVVVLSALRAVPVASRVRLVLSVAEARLLFPFEIPEFLVE
jgi:hypothetical protein